jgi:hypothetical protein
LYSRVFVLYKLSTVEIILTAHGKTPLTAIIARHPFQSLAKQKKESINTLQENNATTRKGY